MKLVGILFVLALAAIGGTLVLKRLGRSGQDLPIEGYDSSVPLTPVPGIKESV